MDLINAFSQKTWEKLIRRETAVVLDSVATKLTLHTKAHIPSQKIVVYFLHKIKVFTHTLIEQPT